MCHGDYDHLNKVMPSVWVLCSNGDIFKMSSYLSWQYFICSGYPDGVLLGKGRHLAGFPII